jgi:hypothetical protein
MKLIPCADYVQCFLIIIVGSAITCGSPALAQDKIDPHSPPALLSPRTLFTFPIVEPYRMLEDGQQKPTPSSKLASASPSQSGTIAEPDQKPSLQDKQDDPEGKQTKRMLWVVPNFAAVSSNTQLPPLSTREKFVLAAHDSVVDYSSFTWSGMLAGQAMLLNSDPELGRGPQPNSQELGNADGIRCPQSRLPGILARHTEESFSPEIT